jgi:hypothetical protein
MTSVPIKLSKEILKEDPPSYDQRKSNDNEIEIKENILQPIEIENSNDEQKNEEKKISKSEMMIGRRKRYLIFTLLIFVNLIINMDDGTIPAATIQIQHKLNVGTTELGLLGSLVYCGSLTGNIFK